MPSPEQLARHEIDRLLGAAGWAVQCGAYGFADCLSFGTA